MLLSVLLAIGVLITMAGNNADWFGKEEHVVQPNARAEFQQLCARYLQHDTVLNLGGNIRLYDGEDRRQVKEQSSFELIKQGNGMYTRLSHLQTFANEQLMVQLDTVNRIMVIAEAMENQTRNGSSLQQSVDLLFSDTAAFRLVGEVTGNELERTLSFKSDFNPEIRQYRISYDAKTYQLKNATIEWWKDAMVSDSTNANRVWVTQIDYRYRQTAGRGVNDMMREVVALRGKEVIPTDKYKDYEVHIAFNQEQ